MLQLEALLGTDGALSVEGIAAMAITSVIG
jgi:hypothetical protein